MVMLDVWLNVVSVHVDWRMILDVFFLERYGDHRDIHSYPTRRNSDLTGGCKDENDTRIAPQPNPRRD